MKRWHKSMKRKPKIGEYILIIWKDKTVTIDIMLLDEFNTSYLCCYGNSYDWDCVAHMIKQWAYVDEYFKKELGKNK